jgi:hypothetical protein
VPAAGVRLSPTGVGVANRAPVFIALCALACALVAAQRTILVGWATALASDAERRTCSTAAAALARLGRPGVASLLVLATDRTVLRKDRAGPHAAFERPDAVCDVALDHLRALREGRPRPRAFEYSAARSPYPSYEHARDAWRAAELDEALEWWAARRDSGPRAPRPPRRPQSGVADEDGSGRTH